MSMNANIPLIGVVETAGAVTASSQGTGLTTSYTELKSATDYEWNGFIIDYCHQNAGIHTLTLGMGAAGAEYGFCPDLLIADNGSSYAIGQTLHIPLRVPAGVRLAGKISVVPTDADIVLYGLGPGYPGARAAGAFLESPSGTSPVEVDPGGSANTKGSWTQLVASTTNGWNGFFVTNYADEGSSGDYLIDIGIGAGGSEMVIASNVRIRKGTSSTTRPNLIGPFYGHVPAGTRIAARAQSTITSSTSRKIFLAAHGIV